jgi:hypothetical protein
MSLALCLMVGPAGTLAFLAAWKKNCHWLDRYLFCGSHKACREEALTSSSADSCSLRTQGSADPRFPASRTAGIQSPCNRLLQTSCKISDALAADCTGYQGFGQLACAPLFHITATVDVLLFVLA